MVAVLDETQEVVDASGQVIGDILNSEVVQDWIAINDETGESKAYEAMTTGGISAINNINATDEEKSAIRDGLMNEISADSNINVSSGGISESVANTATSLSDVIAVGEGLSKESSQLGKIWDAAEAGTFQALLDNVVSSIEEYNANHADAGKTLTNISNYYQLQEAQMASKVAEIGSENTPGPSGAGVVTMETK